MPPQMPRKRLRHSPPAPKAKAARKPTLFNDLDAADSPSLRSSSTLRHLQEMEGSDDSSLSSLSDADFEDVHIPKKPRLSV